jgi:hypothetical protein
MSAVTASASLVERIDGPSLSSAHEREEPHRYRGFLPHRRKGGPPPRVALVAKVFGDVGKPDAVNAAAQSSRVRSASRSSGIAAAIALTFLCRTMPTVAMALLFMLVFGGDQN